jgi:hypothetical protein
LYDITILVHWQEVFWAKSCKSRCFLKIYGKKQQPAQALFIYDTSCSASLSYFADCLTSPTNTFAPLTSTNHGLFMYFCPFTFGALSAIFVGLAAVCQTVPNETVN